MSSSGLPRLPGLDSTLALARSPYRFVSRHADRLGVDAFTTRLLGRPVVCLRGGEAARFFYEGGRFDRAGAVPSTVVHLLQDEGSVQTLEGASHHRRKAGFVNLLQGDGADVAADRTAAELGAAMRSWSGRTVVLHDELPRVLTRVALGWAGILVPEPELARRTTELWAMVQEAGTVGPAHWLARARRRRTERWAAQLVRDLRDGTAPTSASSPAATVAAWRDDAGALLDPEVAAIELLNLLRPVVAVAVFVEMAALALVREDVDRSALAAGDAGALDSFVTEVRRYAPFFPVIAGRATRDLTWHGHHLPRRSWVLLDLYGTDHDARLWPDPDRFDPGRFARPGEASASLVAQGAGDYATGHRCPGEPMTQRMMREAVRVLAAGRWTAAPGQDLRVDFTRAPARVRSGVVLDVA